MTHDDKIQGDAEGATSRRGERASARTNALAADVGEVMVRGRDLAEALDGCVRAIVRHLDAAFARIWTVSADGEVLELRASAGLDARLDGGHARVRVGDFGIGRIAAERTPHLTNDLAHDDRVGDPAWAKAQGLVAFAGYPLVVDDKLVAVLALFARRPLEPSTLEALDSVRDTIALGIARADAAEALATQRALYRDLAERSQRAARDAEWDREIAQTLVRLGLDIAAETDPATVVRMVVEAGTQLTGATAGTFALAGSPALRGDLLAPVRAGRTLLVDDLGSSGATDHGLADAPPGTEPRTDPPAAIRSYLAVPLRGRGGEGDVDGGRELRGALIFGHVEPGRFRGDHVLVVEGIAAQAAVALDNAVLLASARASEERYRSLIDATSQVVWTATPAGEMRGEQPGWASITGQTRAQYEGHGWTRAIHPGDRPAILRAWEDAVRAGSALLCEGRVARPDGAYGTFTVRAVPVRDPDGRVREWVGVNTDVTAARAQEAERDELIASLAKSNSDLDQFAYVASHDLKAPLRGIANLSQWIEEDLGDRMTGEARENMRLLRGRVLRLEGLINGILAYSRAGRVGEKLEAVDVDRLVDEVVELLAPRPGLVVVPPASSAVVVTERVPLQQVFLNLVGNALKYLGRADGRVVVGARDLGDAWEFSVSDDGPGIAPEYHERIWGIFQTLEARDKVEATGIGLSVVKKIVETRGGRVGIESAVGRGARFFFTWPRGAKGAN